MSNRKRRAPADRYVPGTDCYLSADLSDGTTDDLTLAHALLSGCLCDKGKPPRTEFLTGAYERIARKALARLLLADRPLDGFLRRSLAGLFDPDADIPGSPEQRSLAFVRGRRRLTDHFRNRLIATEVRDEIYDQSKRKCSDATGVAAVASRRGMTEAAVQTIWDNHKEDFRLFAAIMSSAGEGD